MLTRIKMKLSEIKYSLRNRFQRFYKGYSTDDLIDFDYYLQTTFVKMIREFVKYANGLPMGIKFKEVDKFDVKWISETYNEFLEDLRKRNKDAAEEFEENGIYDDFTKYKLILSRIAWCIEHTSDSYDEFENKYYNKFYNLYFDETISKEEKEKISDLYIKECERLNKIRKEYALEGFTLLAKYHESMWW